MTRTAGRVGSENLQEQTGRVEMSQELLYLKTSCYLSFTSHYMRINLGIIRRVILYIHFSGFRTHNSVIIRCASGCVVECRICNREVAGSNLGRGYFAPRSAQPSIPPGSANEYQL